MDASLYFVLLLILSYLLGSIPFAIISAKVMGLSDPRTYGSGNPGATNVLRSGNKLAALMTLLGDALKGTLAVAIAQWAVFQYALPVYSIALAALAVFLGHLYPVFLRFRGGKGVATAIGILAIWMPWLALIVACIWLSIFVFFHYSSLAALVAALALPFIYLLGHQSLWDVEGISFVCLSIMSILLIVRHKKNIQNLLGGQESKSVRKKSHKKSRK